VQEFDETRTQVGVDGVKMDQGATPNRGGVGTRQAPARGMEVSLGDECDGTRMNGCDANCLHRWADATIDDGYGDTAPVASYPMRLLARFLARPAPAPQPRTPTALFVLAILVLVVIVLIVAATAASQPVQHHAQ
jgi:hypothetical protein